MGQEALNTEELRTRGPEEPGHFSQNWLRPEDFFICPDSFRNNGDIAVTSGMMTGFVVHVVKDEEAGRISRELFPRTLLPFGRLEVLWEWPKATRRPGMPQLLA